MFCRKCGSKINDNALFCYHCGERVKINSEVASDGKKDGKVIFEKKIIFSCIAILLAVFAFCGYWVLGKKVIIPESLAGNFKVYWTDSREDLAGRYSSFKPVNPKNWNDWKIDSGISAVATVPVSNTNIYFNGDKLSSVTLQFDCHNPEEPPDLFSEDIRKMITDLETYERYKEWYDYKYNKYLQTCKANDIQCRKSFSLITKKLIEIYGEPLTKVENDMSSSYTKDRYTWDKDGAVIILTYSRDDDFTNQSISLSFRAKMIQSKAPSKK